MCGPSGPKSDAPIRNANGVTNNDPKNGFHFWNLSGSHSLGFCVSNTNKALYSFARRDRSLTVSEGYKFERQALTDVRASAIL